MKPKIAILKADGINRDEELAFAFDLAGGAAEIVHINQLRATPHMLRNYQVIAIPGGFAYGDDIASGKILATELTSFFADELRTFIDRKDTAILGICNGFQALIRTGLVPFDTIGEMHATLTNNDSGHFECRWIRVKIEPDSRCVFLKNLELYSSSEVKRSREVSSRQDGYQTVTRQARTIPILTYPIAHGEGKFFTDEKTLKRIEDDHFVAFRYVDENGKPTQTYPDNPNGSLHAIVGITDRTGRILGMMPHPECFVQVEQHPNWRRESIRQAQDKPQGLPLFENIVHFVKHA